VKRALSRLVPGAFAACALAALPAAAGNVSEPAAVPGGDAQPSCQSHTDNLAKSRIDVLNRVLAERLVSRLGG